MKQGIERKKKAKRKEKNFFNFLSSRQPAEEKKVLCEQMRDVN